MNHLTILGRVYCHLCDEMLQALQHALSNHDSTIVIHSVDLDQCSEVLQTRWDEWVPVLLPGTPDEAIQESEPLCYHSLDVSKVEKWLLEFAYRH